MLVLAVRTDKPEAELGLYDAGNRIAYESWQAHRELAETIHVKLEALLKSQKRPLHDIKGIVAYKGPGSFTGLRIGLSVANALAYSLEVPAIAVSGDTWQTDGIKMLQDGNTAKVLLPEYGADVHITQQKK